MEAEQIRKIYEAMNDNGFNSIELELGDDHKIRMQLDNAPVWDSANDAPPEAAEHENGVLSTQVEIRSDKVGSFSFAERQLKAGDHIKKGEILGSIKGISFQDRVKCSLDGTIASVEVEPGTIVDYGRLLFVVNID
ncbi:MAG: hypothetical protein CVV42_09525 [Candidatus Riflebacteria bacterium HGW-Riflebacteria-2]|jgi:biotin carboxyl carrier protein|nr:MAG: hypothetical protein CVV42_09525 [Candidatus Riflebacteria bacterium HGW-Riflebacteria-2]